MVIAMLYTSIGIG